MQPTRTVSLLGFAAFERTTLEAVIRLAAQRRPACRYTDAVHEADVVLVNAESDTAMQDPRAPASRSIYIGARAHAGALGRLDRPLNMNALLKLLHGAAPAEPEGAEPAATRLPPPQPEPPSAVGAVPGGETILVVDDSPVALRYLADALTALGHEVHLARNGEEALRRVAMRHYTFIFLDVTMPGIDGYQTCKLIKRGCAIGHTAPTVVMHTSRSGIADKMRGTLAGCDAFLTKPLQDADLLRLVGPPAGRARTGEPMDATLYALLDAT